MHQRTSSSRSILTGTIAGAAILALASAAAQGPGDAPAFAQATAGKQDAQKTVLEGVYTAAQAERGAAVYDAQCAQCHDGADVDGPPLTGTPFLDRWREDTLDALFEFTRTKMPQTAPGSLPEAAYVDIVAHLLHENDVQAGSRELTKDVLASTLLVGPNGPQPLPNGALVGVVGCLAKGPAGEWTVARAGRPSRVREAKEVSAAEAAAASGAGVGTGTFTLQNVGDGGTALPGNGAEGQKVLVKGALTQRAGAGRIHVTAARGVAGSCG
jgi:hypothetical protein